jgi:hypothetical protein
LIGNITRRSAVNALVGAAGLSAIPMAASAMAHDPIFATIEAHKKVWADYTIAIRETDDGPLVNAAYDATEYLPSSLPTFSRPRLRGWQRCCDMPMSSRRKVKSGQQNGSTKTKQVAPTTAAGRSWHMYLCENLHAALATIGDVS